MNKAPRKPKKNGYKLPEPLPAGEILEDIGKRKWVLGPSIGIGGFGEIYSAREFSSSNKSSEKFPFVVKIEPHANGPLFVEMHFYMRNAKAEDVDLFKSTKKLQSFGMPKYIASGSHQHNGTKYRFLVMEKFGSDIWKLFLENNRKFPSGTVFKLGVQILNVLEYIHSKGYVHADIKGANILIEQNSKNPKQVFLVDFGLASHYSSTLKPDPKKAHNGTIEYTSRDAHLGVQTRRGDLEILAYNLLQWLGCRLPWENISDPVTVQKSKENYMSDTKKLFECFESGKVPGPIEKFFKYVTGLEVDKDPDYKYLRKLLIDGIESEGDSLNFPLQFETKKRTPVKRKVTKSPGPSVKQKKNGKVTTKTSKKRASSPAPENNSDEETNSKEDLNGSQILTQEMKRLKEKIEMKKANNKRSNKTTNTRVLRSSGNSLPNQ